MSKTCGQITVLDIDVSYKILYFVIFIFGLLVQVVLMCYKKRARTQ